MGKKRKDTIELRFYEVPQNEYVLALLGDRWIRDYGYEGIGLHFHNLMEIGFCRQGTGRLVLNEEEQPYREKMVSIIPQNYPHVTIGDHSAGKGHWEYLFFDPAQVIAEMYPDDVLMQRKMLEKLSRKALLIDGQEHPQITWIVNSIMDEMRSTGQYYRECIRGLILTLAAVIIRLNENEKKAMAQVHTGRNTGVSQIAAALDYVRLEYDRIIKVEELAKACHMSETHFRRVFESCMNMPPVDYMNLVRVQKACDYMKKSNDSMDIVAQKVGFTSTSTFNRNFRKFLNTSPYQWKINPQNYERKLLNYNISALKGW